MTGCTPEHQQRCGRERRQQHRIRIRKRQLMRIENVRTEERPRVAAELVIPPTRSATSTGAGRPGRAPNPSVAIAETTGRRRTRSSRARRAPPCATTPAGLSGRALDRRGDGGPARQARTRSPAAASGDRWRREAATTAIAARSARSGLRAVRRTPPRRRTVPPVSAMTTATTTSASASQSRAVAARDRCTSSAPYEESRPESGGFYRDRRPSARSSTRMRAASRAPKPSMAAAPRNGRLREQRKSQQLPDDARCSSDGGRNDRVRRACDAIRGGTSTRNVQRSPSVAIAQYLRALAARNTAAPTIATVVTATSPPPRFEEHDEEASRIGGLHPAIHIAVGLDGAGARATCDRWPSRCAPRESSAQTRAARARRGREDSRALFYAISKRTEFSEFNTKARSLEDDTKAQASSKLSRAHQSGSDPGIVVECVSEASRGRTSCWHRGTRWVGVSKERLKTPSQCQRCFQPLLADANPTPADGRRASSFELPNSSSCRLRELRDFVLNPLSSSASQRLPSSLLSSSHHVTGVGDRSLEVVRRQPGGTRRDPERHRRSRQGAQRPSNRHFDANSRRGARERSAPDAAVVSTMLERVQGHARGQFAAAHCEAQTIAGHGIDEARGVAGQQQAWHTAR